MSTDLFDPADLETQEPSLPEDTPESAYIPDTNGDPEGSEVREQKLEIVLPDFFYRRYHLNDEGNPTYNLPVVESIMEVFDLKVKSPLTFKQTADENDADKDEKYYDSQVLAVINGIKVLLEVDPQSTGINILSLNTRTWAEFISIAYEYSDSLTSISANDDLPDWLINREDKMMQLGRKARILRDAIICIDDKFGLKSTSLDRDRVQTEVERRLQRLAEWNFNQHADKSGKTANAMNRASVQHCETVFAAA